MSATAEGNVNPLGNLSYNTSTGDNTYTSLGGQTTDFGPGSNVTLQLDGNGNLVMTDNTSQGNSLSCTLDPLGNLINPNISYGGGGGSTGDGGWTNQADAGFNTAQTDPVVLDMSGMFPGAGDGAAAGVQLTSLAESNAYFDLHGTGFAVHTGWVGPTTGLLVDTPDPTNIRDLFGSSSVDGFTALAA